MLPLGFTKKSGGKQKQPLALKSMSSPMRNVFVVMAMLLRLTQKEVVLGDIVLLEEMSCLRICVCLKQLLLKLKAALTESVPVEKDVTGLCWQMLVSRTVSAWV